MEYFCVFIHSSKFARLMDFSRPDLFAGSPFATYDWYFLHLLDPGRFATSVIFAVARQLTFIIHSLHNSFSDYY